VQRRALGLADTEARRLFVGAIDLSFSSNDECAAAATLTHIDINLTWQHTACPQRTLIAGTGYADSLAGVVHSSLTEQKGVGWISHVFGRVPELSGAVLLESLKTVLPNQQELRVNRTRRRSGRGPVTVTATLLSNGQTRNLDDVQWLEKTAAGALFPESITLVLPELHWQLNLDVPATIADQVEPTLTTAQQHGVLVKLTSLDSNTTGASADSPLAPGVVTLHPRPQP